MAIRVRCSGCRKKIAVDEAFAGGVCRCPYCGTLSTIAHRRGQAAAAERPDRPDTPGVPGTPAPAPRAAPAAVPVAKPVMIQGVIAIVLGGFALLMLAAAGAVLYTLSRRGVDRGRQAPAPRPVNPITQAGARVAGMEIKAPVVYVLDGGSGATGVFDLGAALVRHSVRGLEAGDRFNVIFVSEEGIEQMAKGWTAGGEGGDERLKAFLADKATVGASDLDAAVGRAVGLSPRALVLLAAKAPGDPDALAQKARAAGVPVHCVSLGAYGDVNEAMRTLAEKTHGRFRSFTEYDLERFLADAPPLP